MKLILTTVLLASSMFASSNFEDNVEYKCLNSYNIEKGKRFNITKEVALNKPLYITIKDNKIHTSEKAVFSFLMQKDDMKSYSDENFMVLLMKGKNMGLVPKKSRGQLQYYFKCEKK